MPRVRSALGQFYGSVRSALGQFYGSVRSALGHVRSVLCQFYARAPAKQKYHKRRNAHVTPEFRVRTPYVVRAASSLVEVAPATDEAHLTGRGSVPRGATPAADAEGDRLLGLVLVLSLARLLVDRPRRGPPAAKRPLRLRCCASAAAPRCASLASCSPRSPLPWVSFNATPCIKLCLCLAGGGLGARRLAVCCLRSVERNGRWDGRPRGPRGSHLALADPDRGEKLRAALCWLM